MKNDILQRLRKIAPSMTWSAKIGTATFDYGTPAFPWGRKADAVLINWPNEKTPRRQGRYEGREAYLDRKRKAAAQEEAARDFVRSVGGQCTVGGAFATIEVKGTHTRPGNGQKGE